MRQIVLDTETTGLDPKSGHRIIEIGCVELIDRKLTGNVFHQYIQPDREIDPGAIEVHGITNEFLQDKLHFEDLVEDFVAYIRGAELVIHNAPFDVGFINNELKRCEFSENVESLSSVLDTLAMARKMHPGQKNNLNALCKRYEINNTHRELHGALLDAEILADVYLAMSGGQTNLFIGGGADSAKGNQVDAIRRLPKDRPETRVLRANETELQEHQARLDGMQQSSGKPALWNTIEGTV